MLKEKKNPKPAYFYIKIEKEKIQKQNQLH